MTSADFEIDIMKAEKSCFMYHSTAKKFMVLSPQADAGDVYSDGIYSQGRFGCDLHWNSERINSTLPLLINCRKKSLKFKF